MLEADPLDTMTRRCFVLGASQALLLSGLSFQLYRLQVRDRARYEMLSANNRLTVRLIPAPRGRLLDCTGTPLALNRNSFRLIVLAENRRELKRSLQNLTQLIELPHLNLEAFLRECKKHPHHLVPLVLKEPLSWEEVSILEMHRSDLIGVAVETGQARFYPLANGAAHFLGYVGLPSKEDGFAKNTLTIPGFRTGRSGIERLLDVDLKGTEGTLSLEVNAHRQVMRELESRPTISGTDIQTSIDGRLQAYVAKRLEVYESASVVVLDINGEIRALVSHPAFDPHLFVNGIRVEAWRDLQTNPYKPLLNKALSGLYAPGSTIKMAVALAALEKGVITPSTAMHCWGVTMLNNHRFHCWMHKKGGHKSVNCYQAIVRSCDVFFYEVARRTGIDTIVPVMRALGLGENLLPDFRETLPGLLPTPQWKKQHRRYSWNASDTMLTGIGQGYMLSTPLQLAVMAARLATGKSVVPSYLHSDVPQAFADLPYAAMHLELMRESMAGVTGDPWGTGFRYRITDPGLEMAGKTGTSQVRRITLQDREKGLLKTDDLPWVEREHALFCGYAPLKTPRYAISVVVEHGGGGGSVATPIARDILRFAQAL